MNNNTLIKGDAIIDSPTEEKAIKEVRELLSKGYPKSAIIKIALLDNGEGCADTLRTWSREEQ